MVSTLFFKLESTSYFRPYFDVALTSFFDVDQRHNLNANFERLYPFQLEFVQNHHLHQNVRLYQRRFAQLILNALVIRNVAAMDVLVSNALARVSCVCTYTLNLNLCIMCCVTCRDFVTYVHAYIWH